jgi:hypothetical protein
MKQHCAAIDELIVLNDLVANDNRDIPEFMEDDPFEDIVTSELVRIEDIELDHELL